MTTKRFLVSLVILAIVIGAWAFWNTTRQSSEVEPMVTYTVPG